MKSNTKQNLPNIKKVVIVLIGLVSLLASVVSIYTLLRVQAIDITLSEQTSTLQSDVSRLRFCYDNDLVQCDDASISAWNETHPNDTFNY